MTSLSHGPTAIRCPGRRVVSTSEQCHPRSKFDVLVLEVALRLRRIRKAMDARRTIDLDGSATRGGLTLDAELSRLVQPTGLDPG